MRVCSDSALLPRPTSTTSAPTLPSSLVPLQLLSATWIETGRGITSEDESLLRLCPLPSSHFNYCRPLGSRLEESPPTLPPSLVPLQLLSATWIETGREITGKDERVPESLLSDNGTEFVNQIMEEIEKIWRVERKKTLPYHSRGNGVTERVNRSILEGLRKVVSDVNDWEDALPFVAWGSMELVKRRKEKKEPSLSGMEAAYEGGCLHRVELWESMEGKTEYEVEGESEDISRLVTKILAKSDTPVEKCNASKVIICVIVFLSNSKWNEAVKKIVETCQEIVQSNEDTQISIVPDILSARPKEVELALHERMQAFVLELEVKEIKERREKGGSIGTFTQLECQEHRVLPMTRRFDRQELEYAIECILNGREWMMGKKEREGEQESTKRKIEEDGKGEEKKLRRDDKGRRDGQCYNCQGFGHVRAECWLRLAPAGSGVVNGNGMSGVNRGIGMSSKTSAKTAVSAPKTDKPQSTAIARHEEAEDPSLRVAHSVPSNNLHHPIYRAPSELFLAIGKENDKEKNRLNDYIVKLQKALFDRDQAIIQMNEREARLIKTLEARGETILNLKAQAIPFLR
uniref:Integrase catalytic domain-containing protein n=1 Tax=Pristionchus pacificus TaxID=54126 RepID=A0A8R1YRS5_PRIPA